MFVNKNIKFRNRQIELYVREVLTDRNAILSLAGDYSDIQQ